MAHPKIAFEVSSIRNVIDWTALPIILILFIATLIRSVFGFGEALIAVPLLALMMPVEVAAPLAVLVSITIAFLNANRYPVRLS